MDVYGVVTTTMWGLKVLAILINFIYAAFGLNYLMPKLHKFTVCMLNSIPPVKSIAWKMRGNCITLVPF